MPKQARTHTSRHQGFSPFGTPPSSYSSDALFLGSGPHTDGVLAPPSALGPAGPSLLLRPLPHDLHPLLPCLLLRPLRSINALRALFRLVRSHQLRCLLLLLPPPPWSPLRSSSVICLGSAPVIFPAPAPAPSSSFSGGLADDDFLALIQQQ